MDMPAVYFFSHPCHIEWLIVVSLGDWVCVHCEHLLLSHQTYDYETTFISVVVTIVSQHAYTEEYEQQRGKGSFPAMITPGYQMAKKANDMASDVSFESK